MTNFWSPPPHYVCGLDCLWQMLIRCQQTQGCAFRTRGGGLFRPGALAVIVSDESTCPACALLHLL